MTRSEGESRAQRASRRSNNAAAAAAAAVVNNSNNNNEDEREVKEERSRRRLSLSNRGRDRSEGGKSKRRSGSNNRGDGPPPPPPQNGVLGAFYNMLQQGAPQQQRLGGGDGGGGGGDYEEINIDLQIASNVLEAAAGNLSLAMNLYWDHYFASQANNDADDHLNDEVLNRKPAARAPGMDDDESNSDGNVKETIPSRRSHRRRSSRNSSSRKNLKRPHLDDDASPHPKRRLRRSLDSDFRAAEEKSESKNVDAKKKSNNDESNDNDEKMPAIRRNGNRGEGSDENNDISNNDDKEVNGNAGDALSRRQRRRGEPQRIIVHDGQVEASISVSDDECDQMKKKPRRRGNPPREPCSKADHRISSARRAEVLKAAESISRKVLPNSKKLFRSPEQRKGRRCGNTNFEDGNDPNDQNPEDYISDSDWLEADSEPSNSSESLWGTFIPLPPALPPGEDNNDNTNNEEGNVVAEDDDEIHVMREEEDAHNTSSVSGSAAVEAVSSVAGIPHTWLNAGFELSDCGSGLVIKSPNVEDIEFFSWRQQQVNDRRNSVPPPYHCKALTAITSIVAALLYTGVSIQGNEVNCTSGKPPWDSLTTEEKKREFESRLVDALSSLIFVAARASLKRKQKAYRKATRACSDMDNIENTTEQATEIKKEITVESDTANNTNNSNAPDGRTNITAVEKKVILKNKKEQMRRRLDLIPTCVWSDKKVAVSPRTADGPLYNSKVKIQTSWTNIRDIQLYVRSNMRAFTTRGGIALFLETMLRIHGNNVIARQLKEDTPSGGESSACVAAEHSETWGVSSNKNISALICCTCEERQQKMNSEQPLPLNVRIDPRKLLDTTPPGNECASIHLLTLMLTGHSHSDWKNCSTGGLGFGLLTENNGEVGHSLARPIKPVWLLRGETCYSVLSFEGRWGCKSGGQFLRSISKVDQPGISLDFCHWNGWYGQHKKSGMRLITSAETNLIPAKKLLRRFSERHRGSCTENTKSLLMERRRFENLVNAVSAEEHESNEAREREILIRTSELERMKIHPDDQRLYLQNYHMWRFDVGNDEDEDTPLQDRKQRAENWIPYFRLTSRQKKIVEIKLGPKINRIIRTRWPDAKIDNFTPKGGEFPVV
mmetsp:Transcript_29270/g.32834  ORF Transcript_29270/g.32834 Transcript_29270/m.32834 type:complete len:1116 (-) Transcript_29270:69-3416(-)